MSKEAMTLALEALKYDADYDTSVTLQKAAIYALENAIADAEKQEPYTDVVSHWHYWMAEADKYRFALQNLEEALAKQEQGEHKESVRLECVVCKTVYEDGVPPQVAKQEQGEPVAWTIDSLEQDIYENTREFVSLNVMEWLLNRLNSTPQPAQKPWVGLTYEEPDEIAAYYGLDCMAYGPAFRAIEAKLKEKNT